MAKLRFKSQLARKIAKKFVLGAVLLIVVLFGFFRFALRSDLETAEQPFLTNIAIYAIGIQESLTSQSGAQLVESLARIEERRFIATTVSIPQRIESVSSPNGALRADFRARQSLKIGLKHIDFGYVKGTPAALVSEFTENRVGSWALFTYIGFSRNPRKVLLTFFAGTLLLLGLGLLYLQLTKSLKPIFELSHVVQDIGNGNLAARAIYASPDELGLLAKNINSMANSISKLLHDKEELLLGVSHELRTPLTRAKLELEFMPESTTREALRTDLNEIAAIVEELLEYGRLGSEVNINKQLLNTKELPQLWAQATGNCISVAFGLESNAVDFFADHNKLVRIFRNIFENSQRYGLSDTGLLNFSVKVSLSKGTLTIEMLDTGKGVPSDLRERIFEPFYRAEQSRSKQSGGLGLGLAISRRIAIAHGGALFENGTAGEQGAHFVLELPLPS